MKHKVSELDGALLDAAVAMADGKWSSESVQAIAEHPGVWRPSLNWAIGGPIIEREKIELQRHNPPNRGWMAFVFHGNEHWAERGSTPLIAAMRAYVASKFGDEVDLP